MVFAPHCELLLYFIKKYIFSQHQPLVSTNTGKANVTEHKIVGTKLSTKLFTKTMYKIQIGANFICY